MLILAGVSVSAIVGEDGILTKAMMASKQQKIAADLESLNMELTGLNTDLIVGLQIGINQFVSLLVNSDPYQIQNTLERMPEKLVDLIYDTIDEN